MIQIYKANNTEYSQNGDMVLMPSECKHKAVLNGTWELTLEHPMDREERWKLIEEGAVIAAPSFHSNKQLFRIYRKQKSDDGIIAYARPVFMDATNDCILQDVRPTDVTGQQALDIMMAGTKYSGKSDITDISTAYYVRKNLIEAINGKIEQSFVKRWGGEIIYDNYIIHINQRAGQDRGLRVQYGLNLNSIEENINRENIITRIIPISYNGYTLEGDAPWVDSPLINKYPVIYAKVVEFKDVKLKGDAQFDEESFETIEELRAELIRRSEAKFAEGCDVPEISMKINMVDLSRTEEYAKYSGLVSVSLGDTIHCWHSKLEIESTARVTTLEWDCIRNRPGKITLGTQPQSYFDKVSSVIGNVNNIITPTGAVAAEKVAGILDAMYTQLRYQKTVAKKQEVRAILFEDLDSDSPTYGAMALGTQGFQIARERTADGADWDWETFGTAAGFSADCFIGGALISQNYIEGEQGFRMDLNTGEIEAAKLTATVKKAVEDSTDDKLYNPNGALQQQLTQIIQDAGQVTIKALEGYVTGDDLQAAQNAIGTQFSVLSDSVNITITGRLNELESEKETLKGELATVKKVIRATTEGLLIGEEGSTQLLRLDNDIIQLLRDNVPQLFVDEHGVTGNQIITKILLIGNLQISAKDSGRIRGKAVR